MSGKQMEGDNQRRRTLARQARERGQQPSQAGATLGSGKQFEHLDDKERKGPPSAGVHKPAAIRGGQPGGRPATITRTWPTPDATDASGVGLGITYRELISNIGRRAGMEFDQARVAAEATVAALAIALDDTARERFLDAVPSQLHDQDAMTITERHRDLAGFLNEVARISRRTPEQARYQVQATLSALAEQDPALVDSLNLPGELRELLGAPPTGGGVVDPATGRTAALTDDELRGALADLPYWSGDRRALCRTLDLPAGKPGPGTRPARPTASGNRPGPTDRPTRAGHSGARGTHQVTGRGHPARRGAGPPDR